jgi:hypothetical protein
MIGVNTIPMATHITNIPLTALCSEIISNIPSANNTQNIIVQTITKRLIKSGLIDSIIMLMLLQTIV